MIGEITEEQLQKVREPIPFTPTKRLKRDDVLYVTEHNIPHPIHGYAKYHKEYSVIDLRGYRKGYEPRLEISGVYTPNPEDIFRLQTGKLPPYQPTTTGANLLAEMRSLGVHKAFRIGKLEEVPAVPEVVPHILPLEQVSKLETRAPLDLIRKDESVKIERLTKEIQAEGITEPITIRVRGDGSQIVWDGLHRLIVAQDLGIENIPVKYIGEVQMLKPKPPAMSVVDYDRRYTLEELREMARQAGLSASGSKKEIAAKLIERE
ncbi:MAG TPA: ParB N-terminal domain-containing protein [Dehalococcoidia bacterium]|nr:ParB N-terminal domain-containing protein [Dehalococcoidia bacterium]